MTDKEIVHRIMTRCYMEPMEDHVNLVKELVKSERNKTIDEAIQMICSTAPEYGPIEISVRKVHELLNSLKVV